MGLENVLQDISTTEELAKILKLNVNTVRNAIKAGRLKAYRIGKDYRIEKEAVIEWLEANSEKAAD